MLGAPVIVRENRTTLKHFSLEEALRSLEDGTSSVSSVKALSFILHQCRRERNAGIAVQLLEYLRRHEVDNDSILGNNLVSMLAYVGCIRDAQLVFDRLLHRDDSSWNSLIKGYLQCKEAHHALYMYKEALGSSCAVHLYSSTFIALLRACAELKDVDAGSMLYTEIARKKLLEEDVFLGTALVDMYSKCGHFAAAQEVFDNLADRDVVSWTTLITGFVQGECCEDALQLLERMQQDGISPDVFTFACCLKACGTIKATGKGHEIHADMIRQGLEGDVFCGNTLIDMYSMCGFVDDARKVFDRLGRDVVSWNTLIAGYLENDYVEEALNTFWQMRLEGIYPEAVTLVCSLKACSGIRDTDSGQKIHAEVVRDGLENNVYIASTIVDMYMRCGLLAKAQEMFGTLSMRDVVSWTALLTGYTEHGQCEKALTCYEQMQNEGISPVTATIISALKACGSIGATDKGLEIHMDAANKGLEGDFCIGNTLVGMYMKCSCLREAENVIDKLPYQDAVSWSTLIVGYAFVGEGDCVFDTLDTMLEEGLESSVVTVGHVLNACSHWGLVDRGLLYFKTMVRDFGFIPASEHFTCMADLLSRAGSIDKAFVIIKHMPFQPGSVLLHTVLAACQKSNNVHAGKEAFEYAVQLDEKDYIVYVCMSNIYADANLIEDLDKFETMMLNNEACKEL